MLNWIVNIYSQARNYLTAGLAAGLLLCLLGWYITDGRLDKERLARKTDVATYKAAQQEYTTRALENKITVEKKYEEQATKADNDYGVLAAEYADTVKLYKQGLASKTGRDNLPVTTEVAEGSNRSSEGSVIPIPEGDLDTCAENTARLQAIHDWGVELSKDSSVVAESNSDLSKDTP